MYIFTLAMIPSLFTGLTMMSSSFTSARPVVLGSFRTCTQLCDTHSCIIFFDPSTPQITLRHSIVMLLTTTRLVTVLTARRTICIDGRRRCIQERVHIGGQSDKVHCWHRRISIRSAYRQHDCQRGTLVFVVHNGHCSGISCVTTATAQH
jgi:hypothetical protein